MNDKLLYKVAAHMDKVLLELLAMYGNNISLLSQVMLSRLKRLNYDMDTIEEYDNLLLTLLSLPSEKDSLDDLSEAKMLLDKIKDQGESGA